MGKRLRIKWVNYCLGIAILAVTFLVMLAMGWRGGLVVFFSVIDLCFDIIQLLYAGLYIEPNHTICPGICGGIVVDDSIIIAENMHRHFKMKRLPFKQAAIYAINEVGNPTILATFTNCSNFTDGVCIRNDGPL
jgi:multidrug efflux pump subunit AcrB